MIEEKKIIETANMICEQNFIFDHKWDMEICRTPYKFKDSIIWNYNPFGDSEWTFMLNRHKYWIYLGIAYNLTKNEKYLITFEKQIDSWIENVDIFSDEYKDCSRTIELGIRCINWIKSLELFKSSSDFSQEKKKKIGDSLLEQCKILIKNYDDFRTLSNWGIMQNCGIIVFSIYFKEYEETKEFLDIAMNRLEHQCKIQILPDGVHWEQSPMYQNEVLNCILEVAIIMKKYKMETPIFILETIKKIGYANLYMKKPNHHQPMQGDSDDTDLRDIITRCAYILNDEVLKFGGYNEIDFESYWELGSESVKNYKLISELEPEFTSISLKESGNFYLRDRFSEKGNYLWFRCGSIGSGHGHGEQLHFDLTCNGENFISDPGRYTYIEGNKDRDYLKSCYAHNTTIVDNIPFTKFNGSWGIEESAYTLNTYDLLGKDFDYVEGGHLGYINLLVPVVTFRKIIYIKPDLWIIIDEFKTDGAHNYSQIFNIEPDKKIEIIKNKIKLIGKDTEIFINCMEDVTLKEEKGVFSREYNSKVENKKIITNYKSVNNTTMFTVISREDILFNEISVLRGDGTLVPISEARGIEVILKNNNKIVIVNSMIDIGSQKKSYMVDNIIFYGKVTLIEKKGNENILKVIKY